jgi:imidazolonepropionase-like amidohydrolase
LLVLGRKHVRSNHAAIRSGNVKTIIGAGFVDVLTGSAVADAIVVIRNGRIAEIGAVGKSMSQPMHHADIALHGPLTVVGCPDRASFRPARL